ncbi:MAG: metallophosphoesterase family protein [Bacteroidales bacterium]|jgi:calcineurin-like phosphoesterase family protein
MLFLSSDLHISHDRIRIYCPETRGHFETPVHMNIQIISNWNSKIKPEDEVIIIGDLSFTNTRETSFVLEKLHGKKTLIFGNHDNRIRNKTDFLDKHFSHYDNMMTATIDGLEIVFCHYPFKELVEKDASFKDLKFDIFLHGHKHSNICFIDSKNRMIMDVGLDGNFLMPHSWDEIKERYYGLLAKKTD